MFHHNHTCFFLIEAIRIILSHKRKKAKISYYASVAYLEEHIPVYAEVLEMTRVLGSWYKGKSSCSLLWAIAGSSISKPGLWTSFGIIMPKEQTQMTVNTRCFHSSFLHSTNNHRCLLWEGPFQVKDLFILN